MVKKLKNPRITFTCIRRHVWTFCTHGIQSTWEKQTQDTISKIWFQFSIESVSRRHVAKKWIQVRGGTSPGLGSKARAIFLAHSN